MSRLNSAAGGGGLVGGRVNYWGGTDQTNAGTLRNQGIDVSLSYEFDNVLGGQLRPSLDGSYILDWELDGFTVADSTLAPGYDGIGFLNSTATGRLGQAVPEWRATFGLNYRFDIHNINIASGGVGILGAVIGVCFARDSVADAAARTARDNLQEAIKQAEIISKNMITELTYTKALNTGQIRTAETLVDIAIQKAKVLLP